MKTNELTERYIYAVTRRLPAKTRGDVAKELQTLIDDMLVERCGELAPEEKDVRSVLTELGDPRELYEKYDDGKKCLIGAPYFTTYKTVLRIVLCCAAFGLAVAGVISEIFEPSAVWSEAVATWLSNIFEALTSAFTFVTVIFAVLSYKGVNLSEGFKLDDLPPVPKERDRISKGECIFDMAFSLVFLAVFLGAPQIFCAVVGVGDGYAVYPVFDANVLRAFWYLPVLVTAFGIVRDSVKLFEGSYNRRVMLAVLILNAASALVMVWFMNVSGLIDPALAEGLSRLFGAGSEAALLFGRINTVILALVLLGLAVDAVSTTVKALRS